MTAIAVNPTLGATIPEQYGAIGDGTTDDTTALESWVASGKNLALTPGKTYLHRRQLNMNTVGQVLDGKGATLKRAAQIVTTTTSAITSGVTTSVTLASVTGLVAGDQLVFEKSGTYDVTARTIQSIVGSVVTFTTAIAITSASGTVNVRSGWNQLSINQADCRVTNVIFDGNVSNWSWARWRHTCALTGSTGGSRAQIDRCRFANQYGDAITMNAYGQTVAFNTFDTIKGRGIVLGGIIGQPYDIAAKVLYNTLLTTNGDTAVADADGTGAIAYSQGGPSVLIHGNYIAVGVDGISGVKLPHGSDATITDNEIWDCSSQGIQGSGGGTNDIARVIVANNRLYSCGINISKVGVTGYGAKWDIHDNIIVGATLNLRSVTDVLCHDNLIDNDTIAALLSGQIVATAVAGGGSFAGGTTYYYKITGTNAAGETTGSAEVSAAPAANGSVTLTWDPMPGATGYKIYRATSSGGQNGATSLLATITAATTVSYTDTGAAATTGAIPSSNTTLLSAVECIHAGTSSGICTGVLRGNRCIGGQYGILVTTGSGPLTIEGGVCKNQYQYGIYVDSTGFSGIVVRGVYVLGNANAVGGGTPYAGIRAFSGEIANCTVDISASSAGTGIISNGGSGSTNMVIRNNRVTAGSNNSLTIGASVPSAVLRDNLFDKAPTDNGTTTQKAGNQYKQASLMSGSAVLVGGTVTVTTTEVIASDRIVLSVVLAGGTQGILSVGTISAGTSFVINSSNGADTSTVYWEIRH